MNRRTTILHQFGWIVVAAFLVSCGGAEKKGADGLGGRIVRPDGTVVISEEAREDFEAAVAKYREAEKAGWTKKGCDKAVDAFEDVADDHGQMAEAMYNIGAVQRKCGDKDKAKKSFEKTLKVHSEHQLALTHLAVMELEKGNESKAQELLRQAVGAGKNTLEVVPAYTIAATILRRAGVDNRDEESFAKAQLNLRRALAIEAKYMPALFQLATLYYDFAIFKKKKSYLTLASLVCNQGIKLDPEYGPIYHVLGQIKLIEGDLVEALKSFEVAFQKDTSLFGSYLNFAAINLNFRGYQEAKAAFKRAIKLNPKSYDAHIGMGVALRGLGDYPGARAAYKKAAEINQNRTDYIFNLGVLEMDYENPGTPEGYDKARKVFQKFLKHATKAHKKDPDGKRGPEISWYSKAKKRIKKCNEAKKAIQEAMREMAELKKLEKEQNKLAAEAAKLEKKAKELEKKEASGAAAPGEGQAVDEAAIDAEIEAEEAAAEGKK